MSTASAPAATTANVGPTLPASTMTKGGVLATPGFNTTPAQVSAAKSAGWTPTSSPTVMSDANVRENVIPALTTKAATLSPTPTTPGVIPTNSSTPVTTTNPDGSTSTTPTDTTDTKNSSGVDNTDLDYGDIYNKVFGSLSDTQVDPNYQNDISTLNAMRTSADASFAGQIANIQSQYTQNAQLLGQAQSDAIGKESNFLLKAGAYRTTTGATAMLAMRSGQINQLANLQTQENNAIAKIQTAQQNSDYKTMQSEMTALDKLTSDKKALAEKISTEMLAENQKLSTAKTQNAIDNAVANEFTKGVTDPKDILAAVTAQGLNVTLADINKSLTTISNGDVQGLTGNIKNFYDLKNSGSLPTSISELPEDQQLKAFLDLNKSTGASTADNTKPLYTTSAGTSVTKADIASGVQKLDDSKNGGQYADPKTYLAMYQYWEEQGLSPADFIKQYPPKYYIDPADTTLPSYLRPTAPKSVTGITNPFNSTTDTTTPATAS